MNRLHFAPPAGSRSGVADYAEALDRALGTNWPGGPLYHLGNNGLHREIYGQALREPGVAVVHDAVLQHFMLGTLTRDEYVEEFVFNYGEWRRQQAAEMWEGRGASAIDPRYFSFPMLRRIAQRSKALIVHNRGAEHIARAHGATNVHVIPHFHLPSPLPDTADAVLFRERLGIPHGATLFGVFGYLRETKRVLPTIRAFARLREALPNTALLIAGEPVSADLKRLIDFEADRPGIVRLGHLSEWDLSVAGAAIDCCINLRWPGAGETSGIAIRMMGAGKPVIFTESHEIDDFPEGTRLTVPPGAGETEGLLAQMGLVAQFPGLARQLGNAAKAHISGVHGLEETARKYRDVLARYV